MFVWFAYRVAAKLAEVVAGGLFGGVAEKHICLDILSAGRIGIVVGHYGALCFDRKMQGR